MSDCGSLEFLRGGVIAEAQITASKISDSDVSASVIKSSQLQTLAAVDAASSQVIADAIAKLPAASLVALAEALAAALPVATGAQPATNKAEALPLTVAGSRELLLGKPDVWIVDHDYAVPGYRQ